MNITQVRDLDFKNDFPRIFNFTVGILLIHLNESSHPLFFNFENRPLWICLGNGIGKHIVVDLVPWCKFVFYLCQYILFRLLSVIIYYTFMTYNLWVIINWQIMTLSYDGCEFTLEITASITWFWAFFASGDAFRSSWIQFAQASLNAGFPSVRSSQF